MTLEANMRRADRCLCSVREVDAKITRSSCASFAVVRLPFGSVAELEAEAGGPPWRIAEGADLGAVKATDVESLEDGDAKAAAIAEREITAELRTMASERISARRALGAVLLVVALGLGGPIGCAGFRALVSDRASDAAEGARESFPEAIAHLVRGDFVGAGVAIAGSTLAGLFGLRRYRQRSAERRATAEAVGEYLGERARMEPTHESEAARLAALHARDCGVVPRAPGAPGLGEETRRAREVSE